MSGGYFDYNQNYLIDIFLRIEDNLNKDEEKHSTIVKKEMMELKNILRDTAERLRDLDLYLSGDTGMDGYEDKIKQRKKQEINTEITEIEL